MHCVEELGPSKGYNHTAMGWGAGAAGVGPDCNGGEGDEW